MAYPTRLLGESEEIALDLKPHWWYFSRHILTGMPLVAVLVLITGLTGSTQEVALWVVGILLVLWAVWLGVQYLQWHMTQFVITNKRVIFRTGVLRRHGVEIPLERVNNIVFEQGIWERLIGAGDLVVESAGESGQSRFTDVQHPDSVQHEVNRQREANAKAQASWGRENAPDAVSTGDADIAESIRKLADLRDRGAITAEEYDAKKSQLLDRM